MFILFHRIPKPLQLRARVRESRYLMRTSFHFITEMNQMYLFKCHVAVKHSFSSFLLHCFTFVLPAERFLRSVSLCNLFHITALHHCVTEDQHRNGIARACVGR